MPLDSTPVRDEQGSLVTENGGHSLLPSPLSPIPHSEAQTQALAHPCRRTRERSVEITVQHLKKNNTQLCQDKPSRTITEIKRERDKERERERERETEKERDKKIYK